MAELLKKLVGLAYARFLCIVNYWSEYGLLRYVISFMSRLIVTLLNVLVGGESESDWANLCQVNEWIDCTQLLDVCEWR